MRQRRCGLLLVLLVLIVLGEACREGDGPIYVNHGPPSPTPKQDREFEEKRAEDERLTLDEMDEFAFRFSVESLRKKRLPIDSKEVRIWVSHSPDTTRGLILTPNRALFLPPIGDIGRAKVKPVQEIVIPGSSSGQGFWKETEEKLWNQPPEPPSERIEPRNDSDLIIVEYRNGDEYRYVMYGAPCFSDAQNAKKLIDSIIHIGQVLNLSFYDCQRYRR